MTAGDPIDLRLLLVRHGETDLNVAGRMQSDTDQPLNAPGRRQAQALRDRLAAERIDAVFASDRRRAVETAEILAAPHGLPVARDGRLGEQEYGDWEGASWPDLAARASPEEVARFLGDPSFAPPGGESKARLLARLDAFFAERLAAARGETILVVAHGGPVQVFVQAALEIPWSPKRRFYPSNAGLTEFLRTEGCWCLVTFDGTAHLRGI